MQETFENGSVFAGGVHTETDTLKWNAHPAFMGVYLKHLIKGEQTGGQLSCHLVKIEPGCSIGLHNHLGKRELHEVVRGSGNCSIEDEVIEYGPGKIALIPADVNHEVNAGKDGLLLLAKFFPALV